MVCVIWFHVNELYGLPNRDFPSIEDFGYCYLLQLTTDEAYKFCRYDWMRDALKRFLTTFWEENTIRLGEESVELPTRQLSDAGEECQIQSPGCCGKPSSVQHLQNSSSKCAVQGWLVKYIFVVKQLYYIMGWRPWFGNSISFSDCLALGEACTFVLLHQIWRNGQ